MKTPSTVPSTFKRVTIGHCFISNKNGTKGEKFRKVANKMAVHINPETGRGNTANPVAFSHSHAVLV